MPHLLAAIFLSCSVQGQTLPSASSRTTSHAKTVTPDAGQVTSGVYRSAFFGFSYKLPFGWVDRTEEMRPASEDPTKGLVMLAVFEHPPEAKAETINSSVVIAAEPVTAYPGLKSAAQYFAPLSEVITQQGFKAANDPYEFPVDGRAIVRCDYSKPVGAATMQQSTLALLTKGYLVSFTYIGGSEDEVTELIEALRFGVSGASDKHHFASPR